jgi:hypothetical protein
VRLLTHLASWFAFYAEFIFRYIRDRATAEVVGVDRPEWFERCLMKVFPYRDITAHVEGQRSLYLRRFFLTPRMLPFRFFLHHIVRSDDARAAHDHPFDFSTSLLKGSYQESIDTAPDGNGPSDIRVVSAGMTTTNPAEHVHRLDIIEPVWSLVVCTRARREWGFTTPTGWVGHDTYLGTQGQPVAPEDVIQ